jgi:hypothetical protein
VCSLGRSRVCQDLDHLRALPPDDERYKDIPSTSSALFSNLMILESETNTLLERVRRRLGSLVESALSGPGPPARAAAGR